MTAPTASARVRVKRLTTNLSLGAFLVALISAMAWSSVSITKFTHDQGADWWYAWIPAVSTDGAMLVATMWATNYLLNKHIRQYAGGVAVVGIVGSVTLAALQHAHIPPDAVLAGAVGGIPSLMAAALVHAFAMIKAQEKQDHAATLAAVAELDTAAGLIAEADRQRADAVARERADWAAVNTEKKQTAAATTQAIRDERDAARELADETRQLRAAAAADRAAAEADRDAEKATADEVERLRSQARRAAAKTADQQPHAARKPATKKGGAVLRVMPTGTKQDQAREYILGKWHKDQAVPSGSQVDKAIGGNGIGSKVLATMRTDQEIPPAGHTGPWSPVEKAAAHG